MSSVRTLNSKAEVMGRSAALFMNINAAKGLYDVMKTNLGPKGTIKMLVGGAGGALVVRAPLRGPPPAAQRRRRLSTLARSLTPPPSTPADIKLTKDGNVLLREMQIQNPTAVMIARAAAAVDDVTGDGTTSVVLLVGELMRQAERHLAEGVHPRLIAEGYDAARVAVLELLDTFKEPLTLTPEPDREALVCVARTALRTKLREALADQLTEIVVDAVLLVRGKREVGAAEDAAAAAAAGDTAASAALAAMADAQPVDLHMVELMTMRHRLDTDTRLVRGLVLDHGARHPDMPKRLENAYILNLNVSLEYEKSEVASGFYYSSAEQRERLVAAERAVVDAKVAAVIALKRRVCHGEGAEAGATFAVINQKGIDPAALDMLAAEGVLALRRAKRRNAERLQLACGGFTVNSVEELEPGCLGRAGAVYEHVLGEEKFTFVEDVARPASCTILIKGPNDHTIAQIKDAVRDGLRAVANALADGALVPGGGAFEVAAARHLRAVTVKSVQGRAKLGVEAFAEALLGVPKVLAENGGHDAAEAVIALEEEAERGGGAPVGLDVATGEPCDPRAAGVFDNYSVKRQVIQSAPVIAGQLLLVDEVLRAGMNMRRGG
jgi:T-complex protein 1 subunit zeta